MGLKVEKEIPQVAKVKKFYMVVAVVSLAMVLFLASYAIVMTIITGENVVGEPLVNLPSKEPFEFPHPEIFPIYAKPVTWLYVASIAFWFSFLELIKPRVMKMSPLKLSFFKVVAFVGTMITAYEVLYNFSIWSALMSYQAMTDVLVNPDILINRNPNPRFPWNLVFATKLFTALTAMGLYSLYFLHKVDSERARHL